MSVTYSWIFPQFEVSPSEDGLTDVIKTIHWRYEAADGDHSASAYGSIGLDAAEASSFVPYDQVTKQWTIDTVTAKLDLPAMVASLAAQIETSKNPPVVRTAPAFDET